MYLRPVNDATRWSDWQPDVPLDEENVAPEGFEWMDGNPPEEATAYEKPDPLALMTAAVRALPLAKRIDPTWGLFTMQCLLALQPPDSGPPDLVAFAELVNGFVTQDADYLAIITDAKQTFGI